MERGLKNYIESMQSDVAAMVYSEGDGVSFEDKFTEYCVEILEDIGKAEGAIVLTYVHPDSLGRTDWKINGYCLKDEIKENGKSFYESLDLYISLFNNDFYGGNVSKEELTKTINQIKKFLNGAVKGHIDYVDEANTELVKLLKTIRLQAKSFDRINIHFFTNGNCNHSIEKIKIKDLDDIDVFINIWDLNRFYKLYESSSNREPIEINFSDHLENNEFGIHCLKVPTIDESFECYLAIVPGYVLAKLYKEYSNELLESNVRAFLGQAGKYNKGIRDTIRENPQMFLPYNNGITATAETVETKVIDGQLFLTKLLDFQVVNGGQTTASLYHTQKKYKDADLSKIFVQMKLTVIKEVEQKNEEVPKIARFANSQNKVSELDLSSNNPYFVQIESLSRKKYVINPENKAQSYLWFFERVSGQYKESLNKLSVSSQRKFKEQNPTGNKFLKSDIAKYINIWDLEPYFVAQGAQKNFIQYTKKINELVKKGQLPGENFYKKLIANALLYKVADKLFGRKNVDAIGDTNLKSFVVAYTLSYLHFITDNRIDLWHIYELQTVPHELQLLLKEILNFVMSHLSKSANNTLFSEYVKKESSWVALKNSSKSFNLQTISNVLVSKEENLEREKENENLLNNVDDSLMIISEIKNQGLKFWDGLKKIIDSKPEIGVDFSRVFDLANKLKSGKNLSSAEISAGAKVLNYLSNNPDFKSECQALSNLKDMEIVDIKVIYDRLKLLSPDMWNKIIDLGNQTKIFDENELSNIKSLYSSMKNKVQPKEQSLIKGFESISKLKKFGITV
jgi:hypothetical protein